MGQQTFGMVALRIDRVFLCHLSNTFDVSYHDIFSGNGFIFLLASIDRRLDRRFDSENVRHLLALFLTARPK